jgi:hypothetical protein
VTGLCPGCYLARDSEISGAYRGLGAGSKECGWWIVITISGKWLGTRPVSGVNKTTGEQYAFTEAVVLDGLDPVRVRIDEDWKGELPAADDKVAVKVRASNVGGWITWYGYGLLSAADRASQ